MTRARLLVVVLLAAGVVAAPAAAATPDPRATAARILHQDRFRPGQRPQPLRRVLHDAGDWLRRRFDGLDVAIPGPPAVAWVALAAAVLALATVATLRATDRLLLRADRGPGLPVPAGADPGRLERDAETAERDGAFAAAVRLRFAAGLLALDALRVIRLRPSLTTAQVARSVRSERFDALAGSFEAIAYGGRPAGARDAAAAREDWRALLGELRR